MQGPPSGYAPLLRGRRGFLATVGKEGTPHLVPVCFTWAGDAIWTAVDGKPKSSGNLQRLEDIAGEASVAFIVDRWDEDWNRLAWLQARGRAVVVEDQSEIAKTKLALTAKYPQYREVELQGPFLRVDVERWVGWSAAGSAE